MSPLEDDLRKVFRRKEPSDAFAERVMVKLAGSAPRPVQACSIHRLFAGHAVRWMAAAALACITLAVGLARYHQQQQMRARAQQASQQAVLALRITITELNVVLERAQQTAERALTVPKTSRQ